MNDKAAQDRAKEEQRFLRAVEERESGIVRKGLMAKAFSEASGESQVEALYIKLVVQSLADEELFAKNSVGGNASRLSDEEKEQRRRNYAERTREWKQTKSAVSTLIELEDASHVPSGVYPTGFFSFQGRVGRSTFWGWLIFCCIAQFLAVYWTASYLADQGQDIANAAAAGVSLLVNLLLLWPSLAVAVKRWHDIGNSGWLVLINLIPVVGWAITLIYNGFVAGTQGTNRYGQPPSSA